MDIPKLADDKKAFEQYLSDLRGDDYGSTLRRTSKATFERLFEEWKKGTLRSPADPLHVSEYFLMDDLPLECIEELSVKEPERSRIEYWRHYLRFSVNRRKAVKTRPALKKLGKIRLAEEILVRAAKTFKEYLSTNGERGSAKFYL